MSGEHRPRLYLSVFARQGGSRRALLALHDGLCSAALCSGSAVRARVYGSLVIMRSPLVRSLSGERERARLGELLVSPPGVVATRPAAAHPHCSLQRLTQTPSHSPQPQLYSPSGSAAQASADAGGPGRLRAGETSTKAFIAVGPGASSRRQGRAAACRLQRPAPRVMGDQPSGRPRAVLHMCARQGSSGLAVE